MVNVAKVAKMYFSPDASRKGLKLEGNINIYDIAFGTVYCKCWGLFPPPPIKQFMYSIVKCCASIKHL